MTVPITDKTTTNRATVAHLSALLGFVGIPSPLGPLAALLIWKDDPVVVAHAKAALNFNISWFIYAVLSVISILLLVGLLLTPIVAVAWLVLVIVGSVKAATGEPYEYPLTIRFVS